MYVILSNYNINKNECGKFLLSNGEKNVFLHLEFIRQTAFSKIERRMFSLL